MQISDKINQKELDDLRSELESVKNSLESIRKHSRDYLVRYNKELRIILASDSFCNLTKISQKEIVGKGIAEIGISVHSSDIWAKAIKKSLKTGRVDHIELTLPFNGSENSYEVVIVPESGTDQRHQNILCIIRDKVSEAALNESRYDLKLAQSVAHIGSWRLDIHKNELSWSDEVYRIFNIPLGTPLNYEKFLSFVHPADREVVDSSWNAALKGEEYNIEHRILVDGKIKWVNETAILEFDSKGKLLSGFGTVQDITKQKEAAWNLAMSEQKLKMALQSGKGGIWDWNLVSNEIWLSEELYYLLGIEPGTIVDFDFIINIVNEHDRENALKAVNENIIKKTDIQYEVRIHHHVKGERWIYFHGSPLFDESGLAVRLLGISLDVTERKKIEESLRQYAESLKFLSGTALGLGSSEIFGFIADSLYKVADGDIIVFCEYDVANNSLIVKEFRCTIEEKEKAAGILGRSPEGLTFNLPEEIRSRLKPGELGRLKGGFFELTFGQFPERLCAEFESSLNINSVFAMACSVERDIIGTVAVLSHDKNSKNKQVIESIVIQATLALKRKRAEDKLRASEERYRVLFNSMDEGYCVIEMLIEPDRKLDYRFVETNNAFEKQSTLVNAEGKWMRELRPDHEEFWYETYRDVALTGKPVRFEHIGRALDNRWFSVYAFRIGDPQQKRVAVLFSDITRRRKIMEKLRTQAMMLGQVHDSIFAVDNDFRITYVNKAAKIQFELTDIHDVIGSKIGEYISYEWLDDKQQKESSKSLREKGMWEGENLYATSKGKLFWGHSVISVTKDAGGRKSGIVTVVRDISSRKRMEKQLLEKNEHLTRVNELLEDFVHIAAHDLRGPISSIVMMSELIGMQKRLEDKERTFNELIPIVNKLQRTVNGLLETVNIQTDKSAGFKKINFMDVYNETVEDCKNELGQYKAEIVTNFEKAPEIDYVEAYLKSIMKNLITNALKYSADTVYPCIRISSARENEYVLLTVEDNGIGIDLEKAGENLFKPFKRFTSKAEGTGMGLYIIKNIIEKNGGYVKVHSIPHEGTTFYCYLKEYVINL